MNRKERIQALIEMFREDIQDLRAEIEAREKRIQLLEEKLNEPS